MIVVDTTVLTEAFVHQETSGGMAQLRKVDQEWAVPDLWRHEMLSVVWKYIRAEMGSVAGSLVALRNAERIMGPKTFRLAPAVVLTTALEFDISTYDAHFVALARELGTVLYTHDRRLIARCPGLVRHPESAA
jgi:predicted nucleic acid-binding protein